VAQKRCGPGIAINYGDDFVDKLEAAGFAVEEVDFKLPEQVAASYGIVDEPFYICRKPAGPQTQT